MGISQLGAAQSSLLNGRINPGAIPPPKNLPRCAPRGRAVNPFSPG